MIFHQISLEQAYMYLQRRCNRSFFVYPFDVPFLDQIERRIACNRSLPIDARRNGRGHDTISAYGNSRQAGITVPRTWIAFPRFDGSLPSRISPDVYLGNLYVSLVISMLSYKPC